MRTFLEFLTSNTQRPNVGAAGVLRSLSVTGLSKLALSFLTHVSWLFILSVGLLTVIHVRERQPETNITHILYILLFYCLYTLGLELASRKLSGVYDRPWFRIVRILANTATVAALVFVDGRGLFWMFFAIPIFQAILYFDRKIIFSVSILEITAYVSVSLASIKYTENSLTNRITPASLVLNCFILSLMALLFNWLFQSIKGIRRSEQHELEALQQTALDIASELDRTPLLNTIVKRAVKLLNARGGGIYLPNEGQTELTVVADHGPGPSLVGRTIGIDEGMAGLVVKSGEPLIVDDYSTWPGRVGLYDPDLFRAVIEVPLKSPGGTIGVLYVTDDQERRVFNRRDVELLNLLAAHAAIAITNADVLEWSRSSFRQLEVLYNANSKLSSLFDVEDIIQVTLREALRAVGTDEGSIMIVDPNDNSLEIKAWMVKGKFVPEKPDRKLLIGEGIAGNAVISMKPYYCPNTTRDPNFLKSFTGRKLGSLLSVPITANGRVVGVINADSPQTDFFASEDVLLLGALANHVAVAFESQKLRDIGILLSTQTLDDLYLTIADCACALTGTETSTIFLVNTANEVEQVAIITKPDLVLENARDNESLTQQVLTTGKSVIISDARQDPRIKNAVKDYGLKSLMAVPLNVRLDQDEQSVVKTIGALFVATSQLITFSKRDEEVLQSLANQAAIAITKARLNKEIERERKRSTELASQLLELYSYTKEIQSELEVPNLLNLISARAAALLKADAAAIVLKDDKNALSLRGLYGLPQSAEVHDQIDSFIQRSGQSKKAVIINQLMTSAIKELANKKIVASVTSPLLIDGKTVGRLDVYSTSNPQAFAAADLQVLELVADQASIAIKRSNSALRQLEKITDLARLSNIDSATRFSDFVKELRKEEAKRAGDERDNEWRDISFSAAHAIGNPIFAIETILDLLEAMIFEVGTSCDKPNKVFETVELVDRIRRSVDKSKKIVAQFKSLSRVQDLKLVPMNLHPLLSDLESIARSNGVDCRIKCDPGIRIYGEPDRLAECFDELMTNAISWLNGPRKRLEINVRAPWSHPLPEGLARENHYVLIHFRDNGPGIRPEHKKRIFDLFFSKRDDGTGIGLAFIRRIIEGHRGIIQEVGDFGKGADFAIYLPLAE
ncbi:MAG TPA: GAF domain-containing protein [Pyrinomonadaceae bacterium]|nr:GAF domain-containing protein [Pyrinomonadaceae bacterium]